MTLDILQALDDVNAVLLNRHFVYASGKHGSGYVNTDPLFPDVALVSQLCESLTEPFVGQVDTVAAPATGGIVLAVLAARALSQKGAPIHAVWADKGEAREFAFERAGFIDRIRDKRVLVVEDLVTTGGSVEKVCRQVEQHGGELVGVSAICNRGGVTAADLGVPRFETLANVSFEAVDPESCPLCAEGRPIVEDIGHGAKYRAEHPDYAGGFIKLY